MSGKMVQQKKFQDFVGVMSSQLSFKEGNRFYLTDKEFYEKYKDDDRLKNIHFFPVNHINEIIDLMLEKQQ